MDDLISRQAAIDAILHITNCKSVRELFEYNQEHHLTEMWSGGVNDAIDAVIGVESATDTNVATKLSTNLASLGTDCISRQAAINATKKHYRAHDNDLLELIAFDIEQLPSVQPETEWNNHTVACLLAELFGDDCACNYNGIDEWLPEKCEVIDACPNPVGVACWEQFLKHRAERKTDG